MIAFNNKKGERMKNKILISMIFMILVFSVGVLGSESTHIIDFTYNEDNNEFLSIVPPSDNIKLDSNGKDFRLVDSNVKFNLKDSLFGRDKILTAKTDDGKQLFSVDVEKGVLEEKKGFTNRATGHKISDKPRLLSSIYIIKAGDAFSMVLYPYPLPSGGDESILIPLLEGQKVKISRKGIDGFSVKVDFDQSVKSYAFGDSKLKTIPLSTLEKFKDKIKEDNTGKTTPITDWANTDWANFKVTPYVRSFEYIITPEKKLLVVDSSKTLRDEKINLDVPEGKRVTVKSSESKDLKQRINSLTGEIDDSKNRLNTIKTKKGFFNRIKAFFKTAPLGRQIRSLENRKTGLQKELDKLKEAEKTDVDVPGVDGSKEELREGEIPFSKETFEGNIDNIIESIRTEGLETIDLLNNGVFLRSIGEGTKLLTEGASRFRVSSDKKRGMLFDASKSFDPDDDRLTYEWDFGDGTRSTEKIVAHFYKEPGEYTVKLRVCDQTNGKCSKSEVTRKVNIPFIDINFDPFGSGGGGVTITIKSDKTQSKTSSEAEKDKQK